MKEIPKKLIIISTAALAVWGVVSLSTVRAGEEGLGGMVGFPCVQNGGKCENYWTETNWPYTRHTNTGTISGSGTYTSCASANPGAMGTCVPTTNTATCTYTCTYTTGGQSNSFPVSYPVSGLSTFKGS